jgi:uncharacterized protein (TIGR03118 family)
MEITLEQIMRNHVSTITNPQRLLHRLGLFSFAALFAFTAASAIAKDGQDKANRYQQVNLVSDLPDVAALQDTNLVNAWGIAFGPGPFWISANETGRSMVYSVTNDSAGTPHVSKLALEVTIPGEGNLTGQVFNDTPAFNGDLFIFVSEDGTISGWRGALGTSAETLTNRPAAVYKGVTLATMAGGPVLLAANFSEGTIDAYGAGMALLGQFSDTNAPAGYAPFNVQSIGDTVFVTFAKQDDSQEDDVAGRGHGLIDVFDPATGAFHRFAAGSDAGGHLHVINSPWGVALAPSTFGKHANQILVGNFGSGTIMAFDTDGKFRGLLRGVNGKPLSIEGLWGLAFGNGAAAGVPGTLYFTAGPADESHGLFGSLEPVSNRSRHSSVGGGY